MGHLRCNGWSANPELPALVRHGGLCSHAGCGLKREAVEQTGDKE